MQHRLYKDVAYDNGPLNTDYLIPMNNIKSLVQDVKTFFSVLRFSEVTRLKGARVIGKTCDGARFPMSTTKCFEIRHSCVRPKSVPVFHIFFRAIQTYSGC